MRALHFSEASIIFSGRSSARWLGGWLTLACIPYAAQTAELPALQFSLKPRLCVLTEDEDTCYDQLEVHWSAQQSMSLCLYQSDIDKPLQCWQNASEGQHKFIISATRNVTFQLRENHHTTLVSEAFEVIHDQKKYRRQRRNPWSFF